MSILAPPFSIEDVMMQYAWLKREGQKQLVDELVVMNANRVVLNGRVPVYQVRHLSHLDHWIPHIAILDSGLPYPRSVASSHFDNDELKQFFDFSKYGMIWHDRKNKGPKYLKSYWDAIYWCLTGRQGILDHPEGERNRNYEMGIEQFVKQFFKIFFLLEDYKLEKPEEYPLDYELGFVPVYLEYDNFPEKGHYAEIGKPGDSDYRKKDMMFFKRWKDEPNKGTAYVNFGEVIGIKGIVGTRNEKSEQLSHKIGESLIALGKEVARYRQDRRVS